MKKPRFLLVSANRFANPYPVYPIGISYIHSYLTERLPHFDIRIFDFNLHTPEEFARYLKAFQPDYTGISLRNVDDVNSWNREWFIGDYREIIDLLKKTLPTRLILGGSAFSIYPKELFELFEPDFGITGEGEDSLFRLLTALDTGASFTDIPGLVYRVNGEVILNGRKDFLNELDLSFESSLIGFYWKKSGMMNVQTKRGCPYDCIYCTYPLIEGSKVRTLDPDRIIGTLSDLYFNKNINYVFFTDSVFNLGGGFNTDLAERMIRARLNIQWGAYFSPFRLTEEELKLFKRAGLTHIEFGTESLSDATLKKYGKHFGVEEVVKISEICNRLDIYYAHFLILGGYGETEASLDEGFENSKRIDNSVFFPYIGMRIYPGTRLQELALKEGYLRPDENLLEPVYYIAPGIRYDRLKEKAESTGKRWVFPDEDVLTFMNRMRERNRKGSLWHHLKK
ncbi:MAG TPA: lipid biosynthesis B12-binding/radical SAM protein [Bacteroidales bacterium]|nr:lipid biosynthesis B12-binding/radical SAM protein [Bacteroidales bacterium]